MRKLLFLWFALISSIMVVAQTASVTWPQTLPNATSNTIVGNLTASNSIVGSNLVHSSYSGYSIVHPPNNFFPNAPTDNYYIEYELAPTGNNIFTFSEMKLNCGSVNVLGIDAFYIKVKYSVNNAAYTDLPGLNGVKINTSLVLYQSSPGTSIVVPKNGNIKFRIYPYYLGGEDYRHFGYKNIVISGTTAAAVTGTPIENYGAKGFYTGNKFYNNIQVTPLPAEGKSLLTYLGVDNPFNATWVTDNVEFLGFRNHLNPSTYPTNGVVNGNYWPGSIGCRYSKVTDYIDGKNIKVNFVYNGGTETAQLHTASGYFFINDRAAFASAFSTANSETVFLLNSNKTYVTKGGWNIEPGKNIQILSDDDSTRSRIKLSFEDSFLELERGIKGGAISTNNSFLNTFTSMNFFTFFSNNNYDIGFKNIDLLPPHYTMQGVEVNGGMAAIFSHLDTRSYSDISQLGNVYSAGKRSLINSNTTLEKNYLIQPSQEASYVMPSFAVSNGGGKLDSSNTDIQVYQDFILDNVIYEGGEVHGIRATSRGGNFLRMLNSNLSASSYSSKGKWTNVNIKFNKDTDYNDHARIITILSNTPSTYQLAGQMWLGSQGHYPYSVGQLRRGQYITVKDAQNTPWKIYISNSGSFGEEYNNLSNSNWGMLTNPILDGKRLRINEQIPVASYPGYTQTILAVDGTDIKNRKIDNYTFEFENIGLQALISYPHLQNVEAAFSSYDPNSQYLSPDCDELEYTDNNNVVHTVRIMKRYRYTRQSIAPPGNTFNYPALRKGYWRFEFDEPVTMANPVFRVKKSVTQFVLDPAGVQADLLFYITGNVGTAESIVKYFTYSSKNLNIQAKNSTLNGFIRATSTDAFGEANSSTPLWLLPKVKEFINVTQTGGHEMFGGKGLYFRNLKEAANYCMIVQNSPTLGNPPTTAGHDPLCVEESLIMEALPNGMIQNNSNVVQFKGVKVFPNPAKNATTIELTTISDGDGVIVITNSIGVEISRIPFSYLAGSQNIRVNTSAFSSGLYNIAVITGSNVINQKLLISK